MTTDAVPTTPHLAATDAPELAVAPHTTFVSLRGGGRPGTEAFHRAKQTVRAVARALPAERRVPGAEDVVEILYRYPEGSAPVGIADFYWVNPLEDLRYRVLAQVAPATTDGELAAAADGADVELYTLPARLVVQVLHHGPFADERRTLADLGSFAADHGLRRVGDHHEIHLDPFTASTPQDHLRTILRDPVGR
ncbi:GyrI-like domain-containing protein [Pseudonocardia sp. ICBG1293]|uniref:GyrI-like domain-containing protein n=1 Tax=Pseudonocardia sp. ICBG1293 TaxID=2844382 RepID=UPI001CCEAB13|nr:GyrI-like domain-containing protein [Pseudonocardia sp. ICBG1293]